MNLTTEQMQSILDGAPGGAESVIDYADNGVFDYLKNDNGWQCHYSGSWKSVHSIISQHFNDECVIKLSDIRAELSSRLSKTIDKSVCLSYSAKNDTQSELKPCPFCGGEAELIWGETHEQATERAVACNQCHAQTQWVYSDQEAINAWNTRAEQSIQAYFASDERGGIEQEQSVIERVKAVSFEEFKNLGKREVNKKIAECLGFECDDSWEYNQNAMRDGIESPQYANLTLARKGADSFTSIGWNPYVSGDAAFGLLVDMELNVSFKGVSRADAKLTVVYEAYLKAKEVAGDE